MLHQKIETYPIKLFKVAVSNSYFFETYNFDNGSVTNKRVELESEIRNIHLKEDVLYVLTWDKYISSFDIGTLSMIDQYCLPDVPHSVIVHSNAEKQTCLYISLLDCSLYTMSVVHGKFCQIISIYKYSTIPTNFSLLDINKKTFVYFYARESYISSFNDNNITMESIFRNDVFFYKQSNILKNKGFCYSHNMLSQLCFDRDTGNSNGVTWKLQDQLSSIIINVKSTIKLIERTEIVHHFIRFLSTFFSLQQPRKKL